MSHNPIHVTDEDFDQKVLGAEKPVLVDFWAAWCGPCRMVAPILEQIAEERSESLTIAKLNVDESPLVAQRYGIMSIPTMVLFSEGQPVEGTVGAVPYDPLNQWIGSLLERLQPES